MDMNTVSVLVLSVTLLCVGGVANYVTLRLSALAAWQKEVTDATLKVAQDALELANKES